MFKQLIRRRLARFVWTLGWGALGPWLASASAYGGHQLLMADFGTNGVNQSSWPFPVLTFGPPVQTLVGSGSNGLNQPNSIVVGPDCRLYVTSYYSADVKVYLRDGTPAGAIPLPTIGSTTYAYPNDVVFGPNDGLMYVSATNQHMVLRYDLKLGTWEEACTVPIPGRPNYMAFLPNGHLLIEDYQVGNILDWDPNTKLWTAIPSTAGLLGPENIALGPNGDLFVCDYWSNAVVRFPKNNGTFGAKVVTASIGLPHGLAFSPEGKLLVASRATNDITEYSVPASGAGSTPVTTGAAGHNVLALSFASRACEFPVERGELVSTYCPDLIAGNTPNPDGYVVKLIDPDVVPFPNLDWNSEVPIFSNQHATANDRWTYANLGPVFGVTTDRYNAPNIYVGASTAYGNFPMTSAGPGAVFKLSGSTGAISVFAMLPNSGCGLGDVHWDRYHERLFVSNFEDGCIYSYDKNSVLKQVFSPFGVVDTSPGMIPITTGSRVWALCMNSQHRLMFSVWLRDTGTTAASSFPGHPHHATAWPAAWGAQPVYIAEANNAIFGVKVDDQGMLVGTPSLLRVMDPTEVDGIHHYSDPVSDIDVLDMPGAPQKYMNRRILIGERTMPGDIGALKFSHSSRTLELFTAPSSTWLLPYQIGNVIFAGMFGQNLSQWKHAFCAGGATYDRRGNVWSSGDAIHYVSNSVPGEYIYGLQRISVGANNSWSTPTSQSMLIDLSGSTLYPNKAQPGDVDWCGGSLWSAWRVGTLGEL